jgi:long-subunit acyl-CoA synthetase (AMP-forming)
MVPHNVDGELCIRGYNVMKEYWDEPVKTAETIDSNGWLKTGDICSMVKITI